MSENEVKTLNEKIALIFLESNAYDKKDNYIYIDKLWAEPEILRKVAENIKLLLDKLYPNKNYKLLAADKEVGQFGIIPIASLLSEKMSIPLIIWKENANSLTGEPRFFGNFDIKNDKFLILHDVVVVGGTIKNILNNIGDENKIIAILSLVDKDDKEMRESFGNVRYDYVVHINELKKLSGESSVE